MEEIKDMELLLIGLLLSNYMLIKNQRNNLKKFIIVFLFSNIWGGLNLYSMYEHINGIEKINILCTLLLILAGEYIFYYRYKKGTLKESAVPVLSITATKDKVLNQKAYEEAKQYLPERTEYVSINGGNHGGFGSYGEQKGDGEAEISNADQQTVIVNTLENWLKKLK